MDGKYLVNGGIWSYYVLLLLVVSKSVGSGHLLVHNTYNAIVCKPCNLTHWTFNVFMYIFFFLIDTQTEMFGRGKTCIY